MDFKKVTRVELIDHSSEATPFGRVFSKWGCKKVEVQLQDNEQTLKIFIS